MIQIRNTSGNVIWTSEATTVRAAVEETVEAKAYLSGADMSGAYLYRANLTGADLTGAYLYRANLSGADLTKANLTQGNLTGAKINTSDQAALLSALGIVVQP